MSELTVNLRRMVEEIDAKPVELKFAQPGQAVRFAKVDFDTAISTGAFYLVLPKENGQRDGTVRLLSIADMKTILVRDEDRMVHRHAIALEISEKTLV